MFKLAALESACEDCGPAVIHHGRIPQQSARFVLDKHHDIETSKVFAVCGNTLHMLHGTRFAPHFSFVGNFDTHYGIFEGCGTNLPFDTEGWSSGSLPCC